MRGIQRAALQDIEKYQNVRSKSKRTRVMVATRSGVRAQVADTGNSAQRIAPTVSMYNTRRMSQRR